MAFYDNDTLAKDHGYIKADENFMTNIEDVYVGGDITLGAQTVVLAVKCANVFVENILNDLKK